MPTHSRALKLHTAAFPFLSGLHTAKVLQSFRNLAPSYPRLHSRQKKNAKSYLATVPKSLPSSSETDPLKQESARSMRWHGKAEVTQEALPGHTATGFSCMELNSVYCFGIALCTADLAISQPRLRRHAVILGKKPVNSSAPQTSCCIPLHQKSHRCPSPA